MNAEQIKQMIWQPPQKFAKGAWFWWFWLFFIHDEGTKKTGKCKQLMILWSVKNDKKIKVNGLSVQTNKSIETNGDLHLLDGAPAAWYFDGDEVHEDFVLEQCKMTLDSKKKSLISNGKDYTSFEQTGEDEYTVIIRKKSSGPSFEFVCTQTDFHKFVGPTYGRTKYPGGFEIEGTRIECLKLSGKISKNGKTQKISGTSYFQKILLAAPPTQWYWGVYHFSDGSIATYMQAFIGRNLLRDNGLYNELKTPTLSAIKDILVYHAPSKRVFEGHDVTVLPKKISKNLYEHEVCGGGPDFTFTLNAKAYAHACWSFEKCIGILPICSTFKYNEYPAVIEKLELKLRNGEKITLERGVGNMENSWGFLI